MYIVEGDTSDIQYWGFQEQEDYFTKLEDKTQDKLFIRLNCRISNSCRTELSASYKVQETGYICFFVLVCMLSCMSSITQYSNFPSKKFKVYASTYCTI